MTRFAPLWLQSGSYPALVDRRLLAALWPTGRSVGAAVAPGAAGGMALDAAPGSVAVPVSVGGGTVLCAWDAPETVTLDPAPPAGSNRTDLVIVKAYGNDLDGGVQNEFQLQKVSGVIGGGVPAVPVNAVALAQVAVTGGAASIVAGNITDVRPGALAVPIGLPDTAPRGHVITTVGPPSLITVVNGGQTFCQTTFTAQAGRRYRVMAECQYYGGVAVLTNFSVTLNGPSIQRHMQHAQNLGPGGNSWGQASAFDTIVGSGASTTWSIVANAGQPTNGQLNVGANGSKVLVEDIGV